MSEENVILAPATGGQERGKDPGPYKNSPQLQVDPMEPGLNRPAAVPPWLLMKIEAIEAKLAMKVSGGNTSNKPQGEFDKYIGWGFFFLILALAGTTKGPPASANAGKAFGCKKSL